MNFCKLLNNNKADGWCLRASGAWGACQGPSYITAIGAAVLVQFKK